ncbi:MAG: aspartate aminotransferase family protein [Pseudomonadota bacterium]
MGTYARKDVAFEAGEGPWLETATGEVFLDLTSGIAVNALGHAHPVLVKALKDQAEKLWHTSNLFRVPGQERLAQRLCDLTFADAVFFCNSGAEACEGAMKAARRFHAVNGQPERFKIITFAGAFHGRTFATLSAGSNPKHLDGFGPPMDGFVNLPFGDHDALERAARQDDVAAIMVEPIQGEGGVRPIPVQCLEGLRALCDRRGILLIFDEVQTGVGRTGKLFAHQWTDITPDIMAIAKGIGGGFPLGAFLTTASVGEAMSAGTHGSTFGGNPLAVAVGNALLDVVADEDFLLGVQDTSAHMLQSLCALKDEHPALIEDVRGKGLLIGLKMKCPASDLVDAAFQAKVLLVGAGDNVVRVLPPLNATAAEVSEALGRLSSALSTLETDTTSDGAPSAEATSDQRPPTVERRT